VVELLFRVFGKGEGDPVTAPTGLSLVVQSSFFNMGERPDCFKLILLFLMEISIFFIVLLYFALFKLLKGISGASLLLTNFICLTMLTFACAFLSHDVSITFTPSLLVYRFNACLSADGCLSCCICSINYPFLTLEPCLTLLTRFSSSCRGE
jgi:hypothetical protein